MMQDGFTDSSVLETGPVLRPLERWRETEGEFSSEGFGKLPVLLHL